VFYSNAYAYFGPLTQPLYCLQDSQIHVWFKNRDLQCSSSGYARVATRPDFTGTFRFLAHLSPVSARSSSGCPCPIFWSNEFSGGEWVCRVSCPTRHIIGHFEDDFYRPDDQTNSVKALKETSWSSRSGLNLKEPLHHVTIMATASTHSVKGPSVTNPICWTCKNGSYKCAADCEHCVTQSSTEQFWHYSLLIPRQSP